MLRKRTSLMGSLFIVSTVLIAVLVLTTPSVHAGKKELDQVKKAIKAKGAHWDAEETSVSKLSAKERKKRLGLDEADFLSAEALGASELAPPADMTTLSPTLDWRNSSGNYVSPIKNQGSCGSCWAFAVTAALESQVMIGTKPVTPPELSEQVLVSCSGAGSCSGGSPSSASNYIRDVGLPVESCFPYTATNNSCANACSTYRVDTLKVIGWQSAGSSPSRVDAIKNALYSNGPVVGTFYVYNDFFYYKTGVYSYTSGSYAGAHAVLIVGYDDVNQCFIVKNSWGTGWGEAGFFRIAYSEVGGTSNFGYSTYAYDGYGNNPNPPPPAPCSYSISPTSKNFKAGGGSGSVSVSCGSGCTWTVTNIPQWITIASGGSGSGSVGYTVQANTGSTARSATLKIAGQNHTVKQSGVRTRR